MPAARLNYKDWADEVLRAIHEREVEGNVGATILALTEMADGYRAEGKEKEPEAIRCCQEALELVRNPELDVITDFDVKYSEAFIQLYMGTVYLTSADLDNAVASYRQSQTLFKERSKPYSEGVAWMALGIAHHIRAQDGHADKFLRWREALTAYQRSLSVFEKLSAPLRDEVSFRLSMVREQYQRDLEDHCRAERERKRMAARGRVIPFEPRERPSLSSIPVVARIAASLEFTLAEENITDEIIMLDEDHARNATYALQVQGDSMINAHIADGDYVLIRSQERVENNEIAAIVVPQVDDEATLKEFYADEEGRHYRLRPLNDQEPLIIVIPNPEDEKAILQLYARRKTKTSPIVGTTPIVVGKLVGVLRCFR